MEKRTGETNSQKLINALDVSNNRTGQTNICTLYTQVGKN
jgi:arginine/ornithine N-succinyltransferase beta subunit